MRVLMQIFKKNKRKVCKVLVNPIKRIGLCSLFLFLLLYRSLIIICPRGIARFDKLFEMYGKKITKERKRREKR